MLWILWKNRNSLSIEGIVFSPLDTVKKAAVETEDWFLAQQVISQTEQLDSATGSCDKDSGPEIQNGWFKCSIAHSWSKHKRIGGGAWILSDHSGKVLLHSRRSFGQVDSNDEIKLLCHLWAMESMNSHHMDKIVFVSLAADLMEAVLRPIAWPSFQFQASEIRLSLQLFKHWKLCSESQFANRGVSLIAQSVTKGNLCHSYVASGYPAWLSFIFDTERVFSSV